MRQARAPSATRSDRPAAAVASRAPVWSPLATARRLSPHIAVGRLALLVLFVVTPVLNPAIVRVGDERLYVGTVVALVAVALMLASLRETRFRWVVPGLAFAFLYVLEAGVLRGDLRIGVVGNAYRPLHATLVFCACAVLLFGASRERWLRLFLAGGTLGCGLAVVHSFFPVVDPFTLSRPDDLSFEARFLTLRREEGAFVYPGNFGPYAAYVAIVALVALEHTRTRLLSVNLYTAALVTGVLGIVVSGSRAAALGLACAGAVVAWRSRALRRPLVAAAGAGVVAILALGLVTGVLAEIVESRLLNANVSLALRVDSWERALEAFRLSPLYGSGVIPNTIDSTVFYLLHVGGLVGLALVAAMYWTTLLRPLRLGDLAPLPLLVAVAAVGLFQDSLGSPLSSWAIGAGAFLLARTPVSAPVVGRTSSARLGNASARVPERVGALVQRRSALVVGGVFVGFLLGLAWPNRDIREDLPHASNPELPATSIAIRESHVLPLAPSSVVSAATDGDAEGDVVWLLASEGEDVTLLRADAASGNAAPVGRLPGLFSGSDRFDVTGWRATAEGDVVVATEKASWLAVTIIAPEFAFRTVRTALVPLSRHEADAVWDIAMATWSGDRPDLFLLEHRPAERRALLTVFSGESGFHDRLLRTVVDLTEEARSVGSVDVLNSTGARPDLFFVQHDGASGFVEVHAFAGRSQFQEAMFRRPTEIDAADSPAYRFAVGALGGEATLFGLRVDGDPTLDLLPLSGLPDFEPRG